MPACSIGSANGMHCTDFAQLAQQDLYLAAGQGWQHLLQLIHLGAGLFVVFNVLQQQGFVGVAIQPFFARVNTLGTQCRVKAA